MTPNPSDSATDKTSETKLELSTGTILAGQYKLIELTQTHPILGLTFNAINQQGEGFIVRVDSEENMFSLVRSEAGFLQEVRNSNAQDRFVHLVHGAKYRRMIYFVTHFRPGPTLNQCMGAMPEGKFTIGTATRCAWHVVKAIQVVHGLNYLLRRVDPNIIRFDARTRSIYISDSSSIRLNPSAVKLNATVRWAGAQIYAPIRHHNGGPISNCHDVEALIYLLVDMTTANLPWENTPTESIGKVKRQSTADQSLFNGCPPQYGAIFIYVSDLKDTDKVDHDRICTQLEAAWEKAGVKDPINEKYDWEKLMRAPDTNGY